jgi:hypothetical protein
MKYGPGLIPQNESGSGGAAEYDQIEHDAHNDQDYVMEVVEGERSGLEDFDMFDSDADLAVGLDSDEDMGEDTEANESDQDHVLLTR